jgi:predicted GNAT superfamily acetyltransferase
LAEADDETMESGSASHTVSDVDSRWVRRYAGVSPEAELILVPEDIGLLLETDPQLARQERFAVRERFQSLMTQGYRVVGMTKASEYVLLPDGVEPRYEAWGSPASSCDGCDYPW